MAVREKLTHGKSHCLVALTCSSSKTIYRHEETSIKNIHKTLAFTMIGAASLPSMALDFKFGDGIEGKLSTTLTLGTQRRTDSPNPDWLRTSWTPVAPSSADSSG